jgi:hypothetical protein
VWAAHLGPGLARARPEKLGPTFPIGRSWTRLFWPEIIELFSGPARTRPGQQNAQVYLSTPHDACEADADHSRGEACAPARSILDPCGLPVAARAGG